MSHPSPAPRSRAPVSPAISARRAWQHEALVLRLEALLADVRRLAARSPEGAVTPPLRSAAEALLHEAAQFRPRGRRAALPAAPATLGPLLVELGQARARLEAFELSRSYWSGQHNAFVWRIGGGAVPVRRLRPPLPVADARAQRADQEIRRKLLERMQANEEEAYERGYEDARTGKPPQPERPGAPGVSGHSG